MSAPTAQIIGLPCAHPVTFDKDTFTIRQHYLCGCPEESYLITFDKEGKEIKRQTLAKDDKDQTHHYKHRTTYERQKMYYPDGNSWYYKYNGYKFIYMYDPKATVFDTYRVKVGSKVLCEVRDTDYTLQSGDSGMVVYQWNDIIIMFNNGDVESVLIVTLGPKVERKHKKTTPELSEHATALKDAFLAKPEYYNFPTKHKCPGGEMCMVCLSAFVDEKFELANFVEHAKFLEALYNMGYNDWFVFHSKGIKWNRDNAKDPNTVVGMCKVMYKKGIECGKKESHIYMSMTGYLSD